MDQSLLIEIFFGFIFGCAAIYAIILVALWLIRIFAILFIVMFVLCLLAAVGGGAIHYV